MGWTVGIPSLKLNNIGNKSKHCGNFRSVAAEALKERKGHDPDINSALTASNRYIGFTSAAELVAYSNEHVSQLRDAKGRILRKDAVVMEGNLQEAQRQCDQVEFQLTAARDQLRAAEDQVLKLQGEEIGRASCRERV